jgi:hypothetical protein
MCAATLLAFTSPSHGEEKRFIGPSNSWDIGGNWMPNAGVPQASDDVFHNSADTGPTLLTMDVTTNNYEVLSFSANYATGILVVGEATSSPRELDIDRNVTNSGAVNSYRIEIMYNDRLTAGSPFIINGNPDPELFDAELRNFELVIDDGILGVAGLIGPGKVTASSMFSEVGILVGHSVGVASPQLIPGVRGIIDSEITTTLPPPLVSPWTLDGVSLYAKRCQNLDQWAIKDTQNVGNTISISEYFESNRTYVTGTNSTKIMVSDNLDVLGNRGLRVKSVYALRRPAGPTNSNGPVTEAEELLVLANATVHLERGARLSLVQITSDEAQVPRSVDFHDASRLIYGLRKSAGIQSNSLTQFEVNERDQFEFRRKPVL